MEARSGGGKDLPHGAIPAPQSLFEGPEFGHFDAVSLAH